MEIDDSAFSSCEELESIVFSGSTLEIGEYAFPSCGDSAVIEMTNCSVVLDDRAFQYSSIDSLTITGSEVEIGDSAFSSCEDLTTVTIDYSTTYIGEYAFLSCEDLTSVQICDNQSSDNNIEIDDRAFQCCEELKSVTIGNGSIKIRKYVFSGCDEGLSILVFWQIIYCQRNKRRIVLLIYVSSIL